MMYDRIETLMGPFFFALLNFASKMLLCSVYHKPIKVVASYWLHKMNKCFDYLIQTALRVVLSPWSNDVMYQWCMCFLPSRMDMRSSQAYRPTYRKFYRLLQTGKCVKPNVQKYLLFW